MNMQFDILSKKVIGCAIEVHRHLGPGLLESAYCQCLAHELSICGIQFEREKNLTVMYKGENLGSVYRLDFLIENNLIIEVKSVQGLLPIHEAQILTYMKMQKASAGLLINFNVPLLKDGLRRFVL